MRQASVLLASALSASLWAYLAAAASPASKGAVGEQRVLVLMARFPDVEPSVPVQDMHEKYFGKLDQYLKAISYGKTWVRGKATGWRTLPHGVAHYRISPRNLEVEHQKVTRLIQDALDLIDREEDFSRYSMIFISLGAKRSDYGMMGLCGYPGMLGWQSELPIATTGRKQRIPGGVAIFCEQAHVGVVFHDMAHILGGVEDRRRVLPCLYDHDLQAQPGPFRDQYRFYLVNVGFFDPMSCHYYELRQPPPGPCAWTKLRLGWVDPGKLVEVPRGQSRRLLLGPLASQRSKVQVIRLPLDANTYCLIENRQAIGPDTNLPAHGVLISLCDDRIPECRQGRSPVKLADADPSVPELRGAPFSMKGKRTYENQALGVRVELVGEQGYAYELAVRNGR